MACSTKPTLPQYQIRRWLNNPEHSGSAHVYGYIFDPQGGKLDAEFCVADCNRLARILFSVYEEQSIENVLHKAEQLEDAVIEYVAQLRTQIARMASASDQLDLGL